MREIASRHYWILGIPFVLLYVRLWQTRARLLVEAGRLSTGEAERFRRLGLAGALAVVSAVVLAQITYSGRHAVCAFYESPLRPPALIAWVVVFGALLGFGALGLTPDGAAFLARIWPALAVTKPLDRVWAPREVVVRSVLTAAGLGALLGGLLWAAVAKPGTLIPC